MATPVELAELEHGDGTWENIQEVLRFGFRNLWGSFAGVDRRLVELEKVVEIQKNDSRRQQQHMEAIAQTLNAMSEQLRAEKEETSNLQLETRVENLERLLSDRLTSERSVSNENVTNKDGIEKVARRLNLIEEEMEHVVSAIDRKADTETMLALEKNLHEAVRTRCKKIAFDQEVRVLQKQLQLQRQELENQLSDSVSDFKSTHEALVRSEIEAWSIKNRETTVQNVRLLTEREIYQQAETWKAMDAQMKHCCERLQAQQSRMDAIEEETEKQIHLIVAADREEISRQCSEAHGRIDYQFRTQEESLERVRSEQRSHCEEILTTTSKRFEQTSTDISTAFETLDNRVLERGHQELQDLHRQFTEEIQLAITNALQALDPAKEREQRKWKQHQHVVGRKLTELDQMMQLIGRQLIQNTSQLQVLRNEQLARDMHLDLHGSEDDHNEHELLLHYGNAVENNYLPVDIQTPILPVLQNELAEAVEDRVAVSTIHEDTAELQTRRSQHQELQEKLDKKLRDYSEVLDSTKGEQKANET